MNDNREICLKAPKASKQTFEIRLFHYISLHLFQLLQNNSKLFQTILANIFVSEQLLIWVCLIDVQTQYGSIGIFVVYVYLFIVEVEQ